MENSKKLLPVIQEFNVTYLLILKLSDLERKSGYQRSIYESFLS